jgi:hypothetical protein
MFAFFAVFSGSEKCWSNPAPKTAGIFGTQPEWMLPKQSSDFASVPLCGGP